MSGKKMPLLRRLPAQYDIQFICTAPTLTTPPNVKAPAGFVERLKWMTPSTDDMSQLMKPQPACQHTYRLPSGPTIGREPWMPDCIAEVSSPTGAVHTVPSPVPRTTSMLVVAANRV